MTRLSRRALFTRAAQSGRDILSKARGDAPEQVPAFEPSPAGLDDLGGMGGMGALAADLPPEFLAMEAQRLGLDPATLDRTALLSAVATALAAQRTRRNGREKS